MPVTRRAALVFNPAAGSGGVDLDDLRQALESHFELTLFETSPDSDADDCARRALATAPDLVIAAGGDGTVSMVARALIGSETPLGIVARGTSNSIARGLGIPTDPEAALETLLAGAIRRIDTAHANGTSMLLHASVGFHADTVAHTSADAKHRWGVLAYIKEGLANVIALEPFHVRIETETEIIQCRATNVTVANVAPLRTLLAQGPAVLSPDDGALDVTIVTATGLADAVVTGLHLFRTALQGEPATRDNIGFLSAQKLMIDTDPPQSLLIDGEKAGEGRLTIECRPLSLGVLVPVASDEAPPSKQVEDKLEGLLDLSVETK